MGASIAAKSLRTYVNQSTVGFPYVASSVKVAAMASATPMAEAFVRTVIPSRSVGSRLTVVAGARREVTGMAQREAAERVVADVPTETVETGSAPGRRGRG